jgi:GNAT superfamily N-acetyltransferase
MQDVHPLRAILEEAARGRFPGPDGGVTFLPPPPGGSQAVCGFTAHHVIAADVSREEALERLDGSDLGGALNPGFLSWLGRRLGAAPGSLDVVLAAAGVAGEPDDALQRVSGIEHDRLRRAERSRDDLTVYADADRQAILILGRGLAGRLEVSLEIDASARGHGLGRRMLLAARALVPDGEVVFAQVAPGNAASLRAFQAAGFTPIGSEVLFLTA